MKEILIQLLTMSVYIVIGICLRKKRRLPSNASEVLSVLAVSVMTPCTIISSFLNSEIKISIKDFIVVILMALVMFGTLSLLGKISGKVIKLPEQKKGIWEFLFIFSNNIFIGFPMIEMLVGPQALVYASIVCIPCNALIYSYGLYLIGKENINYRFRLKEIMNPCTAVSVLAALLVFIPIKIPEVATSIIKTLGEISTPLALIILGIVIADTFHIEILKEKSVYYFCFLRLILFPIATGIILKIFSSAYMDVYKVLVITSALPASNVITMLCEKYQNDTELATKYVTMSTILFVLLMPLYKIF